MRAQSITVEAVFPAAPLDATARLRTAVVAVVVVAGAAGVALASGSGALALVASPSLFVALLILPYPFSPASYALGADVLAVVRRGARPLLFPLSGVVDAVPGASPRRLRGPRSAGLYGWWGHGAGALGEVHLAATARDHGALLTWRGLALVVSPEDPGALCAAVLARRGGSVGSGGRG